MIERARGRGFKEDERGRVVQDRSSSSYRLCRARPLLSGMHHMRIEVIDMVDGSVGACR